VSYNLFWRGRNCRGITAESGIGACAATIHIGQQRTHFPAQDDKLKIASVPKCRRSLPRSSQDFYVHMTRLRSTGFLSYLPVTDQFSLLRFVAMWSSNSFDPTILNKMILIIVVLFVEKACHFLIYIMIPQLNRRTDMT